MRKIWWGALALLACAAVAAPARADSASDVYSVTYSCESACAILGGPPTSPNGQYFEPDAIFVFTYDGVTGSIPNPGYSQFLIDPVNDSFFFFITPDGPNGIEFYIEDFPSLNNGLGVINVPSTGLVLEYGIFTFTDLGPPVQNAPEPAELALLAVGLGGLAWFGTRRREYRRAV